jgi:transposase
MVMLADDIDGVIGVDTHADTHTAAACAPTGALLATLTAAAGAAGLEALWAFGVAAVPGRRVWAVEGCGSYGAGLVAVLVAHGEQVVEVLRPQRPRRQRPGKNDVADAVRAAHDALACDRPVQPKLSPAVQALRVLLAVRASAVEARTAAVNLLHAVTLTAPAVIRDRLAGTRGRRFVDACWMLPTEVTGHTEDLLTRVTGDSLSATAERVMCLEREIHDYDQQLATLVELTVARLVARVGVGPVSAAQLAVAYGHHGRVTSEAAFAHLTGVAPIEASSGTTIRYRLNRGGDRNANKALHTIAVTRMRHDPQTQAYVERRRAEGKTTREIIRCLKRYIARQLFRDLNHIRHTLDAT